MDLVAELHRRQAVLAAETAVAIDRARQLSENLTTLPVTESTLRQRWANRRVLVTELACALRIPERTMETQIAISHALIHTLPDTFAALQAGQISYRHATVLADQTFTLSPADRSALEKAVLPGAGNLIVSRFAQKARKARERLDPESITTRHQKSVADRAVFFEPAADGMAYLNAFLPAGQAQAICTRLTNTARGLQRADEPRTLTQLKADVLVDLILDRDEAGDDDADDDDADETDGDGGAATGTGRSRRKRRRGIKADVVILVPALTLLGRSVEPAVLEGYGPIDLDTARELAGTAPGWLRVLTNPETGAFLSVGRERYTPPADLRAALRLRDATCRSPGCSRAAADCDIDHSIPFWENGHRGETNLTNLASLCPKNHRDKHEIGWSYVQDDTGTITWTSPTGHQYTTEPEHRIGPSTFPDSDLAPF
ncbi:DUF222 domain-containing protein [Leifsonia sp. YAF41]|uniref:HNH endonuclease signature motif containing protein n=1 Tax=Leifsonia sp. YAF41 TaxID=3233086 RepID=UPI003F97296C